MTDGDKPKSETGLISGAAKRFKLDDAPEPLEFKLFADLRERLRAFAADHGLTEADVVSLALAAGLTFLDDQQTLQAASDVGGHSAEELERLLRRHVEVEADYAVMKHRLWLALQDNQNMSLRDGTLSKSVQSLQLLAEKLRADLAKVEAENAELRALQANTELSQPTSTDSPSLPGGRGGVLARLWRWPGGGR